MGRPRAHPAPVWLLVTVAATLVPWSYAVNLWFAENELYAPLLRVSNGLLHPALQVCLPSVALYLLLFRLGGLRWADVGWRQRNLSAAVLASLALWCAGNALALASVAGELAFKGTTLPGVGELLGQVFGNALWEETVYRGFFLVQFALMLNARCLASRHTLLLAALLSAILFALPHIPNRIFKDQYHVASDVLIDQLRLLASGLFLAWVYLRTRNLWWAVGFHALANAPTLLFEWTWSASPKAGIAVLGTLVTLLWPRVFERDASTSWDRPSRECRRERAR